MADTSDFLEDRTIKVTGISMFVKDAFVKYFQGKDNDFGPAWDVEKVFVCPDGKDCVLVEFSKDHGEYMLSILVNYPTAKCKILVDRHQSYTPFQNSCSL